MTAPTLRHDHEIRRHIPDLTTQLDEEWVGVRLKRVCVPITMVFIAFNDFTIHEVFWGIGCLSVHVESVQFVQVRLKDLGPCLPIIQVDSINTCCFNEREDFFDEQVPGSFFTIVEHRSIFKLYLLAIGTVTNSASSIFIQVMEQQLLVLPVVATGTDACETINNDLDSLFFCLSYQTLKGFGSTMHLTRSSSACDC